MRRLVALLLPIAGAALVGCGADAERAAAPPAAADATRLLVRVTGAAPEPIELRFGCGGRAPCKPAQLARLEAALAERDPARACTEVYGGPERARVTGALEGRRIDATLTRENGCGIAGYEKLFAALGRAAPVAGGDPR